MILDFFNRLFDKILAHRKGVTYMVTSLCVANSILRRGFKEKRDITPMKLQKLMYFVFKKFYQETGERLFPERFEAWRYGPVIDNVYQVFKKYGSNI